MRKRVPLKQTPKQQDPLMLRTPIGTPHSVNPPYGCLRIYMHTYRHTYVYIYICMS